MTDQLRWFNLVTALHTYARGSSSFTPIIMAGHASNSVTDSFDCVSEDKEQLSDQATKDCLWSNGTVDRRPIRAAHCHPARQTLTELNERK